MALTISSMGLRGPSGALVGLLETAAHRAATPPAAARPTSSPAVTLLLSGRSPPLFAPDPDSNAGRALDAMTGTAKAMRRSASGAALEKLKRLIQQAKLLAQLGGDPKATARQAAELAKRISAAAKEFTASADPPAIDTTPAATGITITAATTAPPATPAAAASPAQAANGEAAALQQQATAEASQAEDAAKAAEAEANTKVTEARAGDPAAESGAAGTGAAETDATAKPAPDGQPAVADRQAFASRLIGEGAAGKARIDVVSAEQDLFTQVKGALSGLRSLIERAVEEAKRKRHPAETREAERERKAGEQAAKDLDEAVKTIGRHGEGEPPPSTVAAAPADAAPPVPAAVPVAAGTPVNVVA